MSPLTASSPDVLHLVLQGQVDWLYSLCVYLREESGPELARRTLREAARHTGNLLEKSDPQPWLLARLLDLWREDLPTIRKESVRTGEAALLESSVRSNLAALTAEDRTVFILHVMEKMREERIAERIER